MFKSKTLIALIVLVPLWLIIFVGIPVNIHPAEDAAILYSYSENLADTGKIVYNINGEKTEGATDFLWMILISVMYKAGINSYGAAVFLNFIGLIISYVLLIKILKIEEKIILQILLGLTFVLSSQIFASIQGFSANFFLMFIILAFYFYNKSNYVLFVISFTILCLIRPDGILIAIPAIFLDLILNKDKRKYKLIIILTAYLIPGLIYFVWRFNYFGMLLPLPIYVKSDADKVLFIIPATLKYLFHYIIFHVIILICAIIFGKLILKEKVDKDMIIIASSMVIIPILAYSTMTLSQNIGDRFMITVYFGLIISVFYFLRNKQNVLIFFILIFLIFRFPIFINNFTKTLEIENEQMVDFSKDLSKLPKGKLAVSEAGRLQYYSKWETIDLLGLNDKEIAKSVVDSLMLCRLNPDLFVLHSGNDRYEYHLKYIDRPFINKKEFNAIIHNSIKYGISSGKYKLLMVPFLGNSQRFLTKFNSSLSNISSKLFMSESNFIRYDFFLIKKDYKNQEQLFNLLVSKYNAISIEEYFKRARYWSSSNNMNKYFSD